TLWNLFTDSTPRSTKSNDRPVNLLIFMEFSLSPSSYTHPAYMDRLYTPWRYAFINAEKPGVCVFCAKLTMPDREAFVVHRGQNAFVCLNTFPYNNGHVMVIPNLHVASLAELPPPVAHEVMDLTQRCERVLRHV